MDDIYENIEVCNPNKKRKIFAVFDDMIVDMLSSSIQYGGISTFLSLGYIWVVSISTF